MTTRTTVITIIAAQTGIDADTLTDDTRLDALGIDSLDMVEIAMDLETALGITLPDAGIPGETVGDIIAAVEGVVG